MRRVAIWFGVLSVSGWLAGSSVLAQEGRPSPEEIFERLDQDGDGKIKAEEVPEQRRPMFERLLERGDENGDGALSRDEFVKAFPGRRGEGRPGQGRPGQGPGGRPPAFGGGRFFERLDQNKDGVVTKDEVPERLRDRILPLFDRLGKEQLTRDDFGQLMAGRGGAPAEMLFRRLDRNGDGKITRDEVPERAKRFLDPIFERTGKDELTPEDLAQIGPGAGGPGRRFGRARGGFGGPGRFGPGPAGGPGAFPMPRLSDKIDTNGDGKISREELEKAVSRFDELDTNGDGQLELHELFGRGPEMGGPFRHRPEPGHGRGAFGPRPSGPRGPGAGEAPPDKGRPRPEDRAKRLIERFDQDGDGAISESEAPERLKDRFSELDRNGDGKIDLEDLKHRRHRKPQQ